MITSAHNPKIKAIRELVNRPKERRAAQAFVAEGVRLVNEAVKANWPFQFVLYTEEFNKKNSSLLQALESSGIAVEQVSTDVLASVSETEHSQGILAVLDQKVLAVPERITNCLILDQVRDPGNLGTLLRSAGAAAVDAVLLPPETADAFAPKVVRAGMGAHFHLPILSLDWDSIRELGAVHHTRFLLADMDGHSCWETDFRQPLMLTIGGEATGAGEQARLLADERISIPMPGGSESLNAGVAGAVLLFEIVRQRLRSSRG